MERMRQRFAQDEHVYPNLVPLGKNADRQPPKHVPQSGVISVASTASSPEPVGRIHKGRSGGPIEISDSEDGGRPSPPPLRSQPLNGARPSQPAGFSKPPTRIVTPANRPPPVTSYPTKPPMDEGETFDVHNVGGYADDMMMTQADTEKALRDFVADTYNHDDAEYTVEDAMVDGFREGVMLLPHQVKARQFMKERETGKASGGILADDMGLGKTISTVTRILDGRATKKDKEAGWSGSTLVVCPVALVSQWENEVKKYAPSLRVVQHHGPSRTSDPRELERAHIVVTSYSVVTSEFGAYAPAKDESKGKKKKGKGDFDSGDDDDSDSDDAAFRKKTKAASKRGAKKDALFRVKWLRVVLDEAHNIKNRSTKAATSCCALEAKFRWCLTGTPMQNSVEELYSLIKFLRVRPLNDWQTFNSQIAKPVKSGKPARPLKRLQVVLRVIMLRRTKTTIINGKPILDLPARNVHVVECEFDTAERAFYNSVEQMVQTSLEKLQQGNINKSYTSVLVLLLRLRQACNHRGLISKDYATDQEAVEPKSASQTSEDADDPADELAAMLGGLGISRKPCQLCQKPLTSSNTWKNDVCVDCEDVYKDALEAAASPTGLPPHSSKTRMIVKILREAEERGEGEKTIIFSQFTSMLDLIEPFLRAEGMKFVRYDGSMDKMSRDKSIEDITKVKSTKIILISFKAGSTGLNLTCCNNVILVDPWWNPALEDQAFDRAHRFGQTRAVNIHKLSVKESVEQRILELQEKKRALAAAALAGDKLKNMRLGMDELVALFRSSGHDDDDDD